MSRNVLDNLEWVERRMRAADEAEARVDALSAQATRRFIAIKQAVGRVRSVSDLISQGSTDPLAVIELLAEIALGLEEANRVRATDERAQPPASSPDQARVEPA